MIAIYFVLLTTHVFRKIQPNHLLRVKTSQTVHKQYTAASALS